MLPAMGCWVEIVVVFVDSFFLKCEENILSSPEMFVRGASYVTARNNDATLSLFFWRFFLFETLPQQNQYLYQRPKGWRKQNVLKSFFFISFIFFFGFYLSLVSKYSFVAFFFFFFLVTKIFILSFLRRREKPFVLCHLKGLQDLCKQQPTAMLLGSCSSKSNLTLADSLWSVCGCVCVWW